MASVKVAVRVRPLNQREKNMNAKCIIEMEQKRTSILNLKTSSYAADQLEEHGLHGRERIKDFFFDYSYWSCDSSSSNFASQEMVYMDLGTDVVTAADEGYNACIFAYGQTGSGKTHTMMGQEGNEGLIPRICKNLFRQIRNKEDEGVSFRIEVSYLEIYNEKVRDLLRPVDAKSGSAHTLKVREHPKEGPYVQGLTRHLVTDYEAIEAIMKQGNDQRTTAATNMNDTSSRSHAIFTLSYNQAKFLHDMPSETVSKLNLVDLAGSERADATGATGIRLKEGGNINKSLVTLGSVISQLAEASTTPHKKNLFIPYRDSVLTWLLKDSLGGNSKTIMIAAISPADCNYAETLSTLRYANRAKNIVNKPTVNEDVNVKLIRDLRAEVEKLKSMLGQDALSDAEKAAARRLHENEERLGLLTDKWKDRWREMQKIMQERELAFQHRRDAGIRMESELPHLVALEDDLLSTGILLYHLKQGKTFVGTENSKTKPDIVISGAHVLDEHCVIENQDGFVVLSPFQDALCSVNGATVRKKTKLQQGDVVIIGKTNLFRFNHPAEAQELREKRKSFGPGFGDLVMSTKFRSETDLLAKLRSPDSHVKNREEDLTKQLEEARSELERQKQDEERRLEEARNEFTKLIREESKRLQETRKELERQQRARLNEAQSPEQIRKHLQELERHHQEEEERRAQREKELVDDIKAKEDLLSTQKKKLSTYEKQCEDIKTSTDQSIDREVAVFFEKRTLETTRLSQELRTIVDVERSKGGSSEVLMKEMKQVWVEAGDKIAEEERLLRDLSREYNLKVAQFEGDRNISDEQKAAILLERDDLQRRILNSQSSLEELAHSKAKVLKRFQQDYKNRYEILQWEKDRALQKYERKRDSMLRKKSLKQQPLIEEQTKLDEIKERYFNASREQTEKVALERAKLDVRKKEAMERTLENQREFNDRVQKYQALLRRGQESIAEKKRETEVLRNDLEDLVKHYKRGSSTEVKFRIDAMRVELNDKVENVHELERNHGVVKAEEEKVIQSMLKELNQKKALNEKDAQTSEKLLKELERVSREQLLQLHEEVDEQEKVVLQCKSNIERYEEKFKQVDKLYEAEVAKHDTELLYVAYLLEKDFESQQRDSELSSIKSCKANLEQINSAYRENIESVQSKMEELWKPLIESREQAQVVLEDVVRAIGIREVTLSELQEQFALERKEELEHIESLREKLADFEEEHDLSGRCSADEILHVHSEDDQSFDDILKREKQKIQDEMYDKILLLEQMMQSEISALKKREESTIACLQRDRENLLRSMEKVEKEKQSHQERLVELQSLVEFKDQELKETRELAQKEIDDLHHRLTDAGKEIMDLQERLDKYVSVTSLALANHMPDELSDKEVADLLLRVNESSGVEDEDRQVASHRISPPPTPVHRFLQSVNLYKKNQVVVSIPRFILRGLGRSSYHVFEVKLKVGDDTWSVFRRYRRFRELHKQMELEYPIVANLEFPSKRYFGNRVDAFVRVRRAQLEAYLNALLSIMSNVSHCPIYAVVDRHLTKRDVASLNPFFQQGVYEQSSR